MTKPNAGPAPIETKLGGARRGFAAVVGGRLSEFAGVQGDATFFWTRWLVLRAVGVVFLFVFAGIIVEAQAILAPNGIAQLREFFDQARKVVPNPIEAFIRAPSLFWINTSPTMISTLAWGGMVAAIAVVLNVWPRMALFLCWLLFLSFASAWRTFSPAQLDGLMLETALLCIPFAPAGLRPGLGLKSPPRPIALFMMRWLLLRVMLENGLVKIASGDPHWRDFSAMDLLYETAPFPTILGFLDHQMPHLYHLGEIALTFFAELIAPVIAVFGGRRARWIAFASWVILQVGIQFTSNFGWLNAAAMGLGLLLLDDQMLAAAAEKLLGRRRAQKFTTPGSDGTPRPIAPWARYGLRVALGLHCYLTLIYFTHACGVPHAALPKVIAWPADLTKEFHSANGYYLYATFEPVRFQVEFEGSNDGGRTWRAYEYRHIPQRVDRLSPFLAPWFCRFEATLEIEGWVGRKSPVFPAVAAHLLVGNKNVIALFARDPFEGKRPTMVRMRGYRMAFTDFATWRKTGNYWRREPDGEYLPSLLLNDRGELGEVSLAAGNAALANRNYDAALGIFQQQYEAGIPGAGFRLAEMHARGLGVPSAPAQALAFYAALAKDGEVAAEHFLGIYHENGLGTAVDFAQAAAWYRRAAARDYLASIYALGAMHALDRIAPRDDVTGLTLLLEAGARAKGDDPTSRLVRTNQPELVKRMKERMSVPDVAEAERRLRGRPVRRGLRP